MNMKEGACEQLLKAGNTRLSNWLGDGEQTKISFTPTAEYQAVPEHNRICVLCCPHPSFFPSKL